ncbi:MAG: nucleotidyltransferase, partial [Acholeplasmataceae bacterium]|nr:nucleotidyltransferase [Acholeplasmataceae bacterium]
EKYLDKKATSAINSGSYAKHTAINIKFDLDICIPFLKDSFCTLEEMSEDIYNYFTNDYDDGELQYTRQQRVSTGLIFLIDGEEVDMDVVSGREINVDEYTSTYDLNLYVRPKNGVAASSTKTNIKKHVDYISGRINERDIIRLLKIWKRRNNRDYKSFLIELLVIKAFDSSTEIPTGLWNRLQFVMEYIRDNIETVQLKDPANSNNIVSDTINSYQKQSMSSDMRNMLDRIDENSDFIKSYFPVNEAFPCDEGSEEKLESNSGATILSTKSFGDNE